MLNPIKTTTRAVVLALALGSATLTAMPVQAQPSFRFEFNIGGDRFHQRFCLSDGQVRRLLRSHGFHHIRFVDRDGRIVQVRAVRDGRNYRVTVDACRGRIIDVDRIRRRY